MTTRPRCPRRPRRRSRPALALAAVLCGVLPLAACTDRPGADPTPSTSRPATTPTPTTAEKAAHPSLVFGPDSVFTLDIRRAPVARHSRRQIDRLLGQITPNYKGVAAFNAHHFNPSFYVADRSTPRRRVAFDNCQKKPGVPDGLYDGPAHYVDVPLPDSAEPSDGTDQAISVWSPETDQLWEFWIVTKKASPGRAPAWSACWGGRIDHVSRSGRAVFPHPFGNAASGLVTAGSMVTIAEAQQLRIEHAVQLQLIEAAAGRLVYPANRTDGTDPHPHAIPQGSRLRLRADVDVDSLGLTPLAAAVARAAQRYGFIVTDTSGAVAVIAESPKALAARGRPDPWPAVYRGVPEYDILRGFPWDRLEVVEPGFGAPTGVPKESTY